MTPSIDKDYTPNHDITTELGILPNHKMFT